MNAIKIGHYYKNNPWSRIAHRGFWTCISPLQIKEKLGVEDVSLLMWFPLMNQRDEKRLHALATEFNICGEWFSSECIDILTPHFVGENQAALCSKEEALKTRARL